MVYALGHLVMALWSEDEEEDDGAPDASEVYKLIRAANEEDVAVDRRRRIALMLGVMCHLVVKMVLSVLNSYKEQTSAMAPLLLHLQTLQTVVAKARNLKRRRVEKEWWVKPRSLAWSDKFVTGAMDMDTFRRLFNMSPATFEWLCCQLAPLVLKNDTNFRSSIPPRKRVAIGIHRLACGSSYLEVSKMFAVGEATVLTCTRELYAALASAFGHVLAFPTGVALKKVTRGFLDLTGLPNCCGAIHASHLKIKRPAGPSGSNYFDEDKNFSIGAQIVVDTSMRILNIAVGFPGGVQGGKILKLSGFFEKVRDGMLLDGPPVTASDMSRAGAAVTVPQYLLGDTDYPLLPWLLVPYEDNGLLPHWKAKLNRGLAQGSLLAEHVFAELRKWGVLDKTMNVDVQTAVELVVSCAILHNVLLEYDGVAAAEWEGEGENTTSTSTSSSSAYEHLALDAHQIRDALASRFI